MRQHSAPGEVKAGPRVRRSGDARYLLGLEPEAQDLARGQGERHFAPVRGERRRLGFALIGADPNDGPHRSPEHDDPGGMPVTGVVAAENHTPALNRGLEGGEDETVPLELQATLDRIEAQRLADPYGPERQKEILPDSGERRPR